MSAHLVIHNGSPFAWLSPDIWVVPNTPTGQPGQPTAGGTAYLKALVTNTGTSSAIDARIDFYWANPSASVTIGVVTFVGSGYTSIDPGNTEEVLCLTAWHPVLVNGGHECVFAVAHVSNDSSPIPDPLPQGYLLDLAHDQIAQLNLIVLPSGPMIRPPTPVAQLVSAAPRADKQSILTVEFGGVLDRRVLANAGLGALRPADGPFVDAGLSLVGGCPAEGDPRGPRELSVSVPRGASIAVYVSVEVRELPRGQYQLIHVVERAADGSAIGGVTYLVYNPSIEEQ